ncbi:MAG: PKD domain-containing protein, partial [Bacteroidota bacterium]|nr:PKD domain-containing protein [Bacteroidota bacterium]
ACSGLFFLTGFIAQAQSSAGFIENKGQWGTDVDFLSRIPGGKMVLSPASFKYFFLDYERLEALHHHSHEPDGLPDDDHNIRGHAVFVNFPGADVSVRPHRIGRSDEYYNYFLGTDTAKWASEAYRYEGVMYESLFPAVDLKVYTSNGNIKYDFIVAPGGDPSSIRAVYQGAEEITLNNGNLYIRTTLGEIIEKRPEAWQLVDGEKIGVPCSFRLQGNELSFVFPNGFDSCHELVIDPLLIFSTFSGSTADNWGSTATPGEHGNLYSSGVTNQAEGGTFPATPGVYQVSSAGLYDIGILKYDSLGTRLLYATYLGGSSSESPHSLVMNTSEELLVLGTTSSVNFPTSAAAYKKTFSGGTNTAHVVQYSSGSDMIISRLSRDGKQLLASTYFGGSLNDGLNPTDGLLTRNYGDQLRGDIIADDEGNVYISSVTSSPDAFPDSLGFEPDFQGGETDALLLKMNNELSQIIFGTYIGGSSADASYTLKLDGAKNVVLGGGTASSNFPVTAGCYQPAFGGEVDGWIAKIAADGSRIIQATYTGTTDYNQLYFLDLNESEDIYVYGQTSGNFPITPGVYSNPRSGQFVQKFSDDLSTLIFSTVFGAGRGVPDISPTAFLVNDCNNLYMAGWGGRVNRETGFWNSGTSGMTTTPDAFQLTTSGSDFYFIVLTDDAKQRLYATFLGGNQSSTHVDGGTSRFDKGGIVYH